MIDEETISIAGSVASAAGVAVTLMGSLYGIFREPLTAPGAFSLAVMGVLLLGTLILAISNQIKIQKMMGDDE